MQTTPLILDLRPGHKSYLALAILFAVGLIHLPFAGKAFHIDDPLFLYAARQILVNPLDPFSIPVNWLGKTEPMHRFFSNPPGFSYYLALISSLFGEKEKTLHLAQIPFTLLAGAAMAMLARLFNVSEIGAVLLLLLSPIYMVMGQTIMPDAALLAVYLLAVVFFIRGCRTESAAWIACSSFAAVAAVMMRYSGLHIVAVMFLYRLLNRPTWRNSWVLLAALLPVAAVFFWSAYTKDLYGQAHFTGQIGFQLKHKITPAGEVFERLLAYLTYLGAGAVFPLTLLRFFTNQRTGKILLLLIVALAFLVVVSWVQPEVRYSLPNLFLAALFLSASLRMLTMPLLHRGEFRTDLFLVLWILSLLAMQSWGVHAAAKYLLPACPALVVLFLRSPFTESSKSWAVVFTGLLAVSVAGADYQSAGVYRRMAEDFTALGPQQGKAKAYYSGHWGFQYYMEKAGASGLERDASNTVLNAGDIVAKPVLPWPENLPPQSELLDTRRYSLTLPLRTISNAPGERANFYAHLNSGMSFGILPFSIAGKPFEELRIYRIPNAIAVRPFIEHQVGATESR